MTESPAVLMPMLRAALADVAPTRGSAVYRRELSRDGTWSLDGARFAIVSVTRDRRRGSGSAWMTADSTLYILHPAHSRREAQTLVRGTAGRIFAVRPNWSMPAPEWVMADPRFWS